MGKYINRGNEAFKIALNGEYVDKTGMISVVNRTLGTLRQYSCVTRCRRFGKSLAANMLCAYYDKSCDSRSLFKGMKIESDPSFEKHLNKYPVIFLDITDFTTRFRDDIVLRIQKALKEEIYDLYPDVVRCDEDDLMDVLSKTCSCTNEKFIMIIDEWDAICREYEGSPSIMDEYVNLLRRLFKGGNSFHVFAGVYMTGILPVKKYNTQSALNNFEEYSMVEPFSLAGYFGFTFAEVERVAAEHGADVEQLRNWYDGYRIGDEPSMYNPYSVMKAVQRGDYKSYWAQTGAYDAVSAYINMNYDGLKDDVICMLGGGRCDVDTVGFGNDPSKIKSKDDVLTLLIHLGYLAYDNILKKCYIPNREVACEMERAVRACNWEHVNKALNASRRLLADTLEMNEEAVAYGLESVHDENTSILSYNDENSLACVLTIAYYYARNDYVFHRELATGKGFADIVLVPRRDVESPAIVLELKSGKSADAAIDQIYRKKYPEKIAEYVGDILLVGINYDKSGAEGKRHSCRIERYVK